MQTRAGMVMNRRELAAGLAGITLLGMPRLAAAQAQRIVTVSRRTLEVKGKAATVFGLTGPDGKPGLDMLLGERFNVRLRNDTDQDTVVHWHGLTPPYGQDGVAMLGQDPIPPGQFYDYDFANTRSGTHWMHSHMGLQEQQLLAAPLIVRETKDPLFDGQEHVVLIHDFTFRDPAEILAELTGGRGAHAGHGMGMDHGSKDMSNMGNMAGMMGGMMGGMNDVVYDAYLANDRTLDDPEIVTVETGGTIRLRIINAAAASNMWIDLGSLRGELIAVDGNAIFPLKGSLFPLAAAQRADIRLTLPRDGGAFAVLFRPEGVAARTGIVLATPGAQVAKVAGEGDPAPALDLSQERLYRAVARPREEPVNRTEMVMLTGGGADYLWGLNGKSSMHDTIFSVR